MTETVDTVGGGQLTQVTHGEMTVVSNTESAKDMEENFASEPKPLDGDEEDATKEKEKAEKKKRSEAAAELGKAGGKAAAEAREKEPKDEPVQPKPEPTEEKEDAGDPKFKARARVMEATRKLVEERQKRENAEARLARIEAERREPPRAPHEPRLVEGEDAEPQEGDFEQYRDYVKAQARWEARQEYKEAQRKEADQRQQQARTQTIIKRVEDFNDRVTKAAEADPTLMEHIDQRLLDLKPSFTLAPNVPATAANDMAQEIVESEHSPALLRYLSEHPEEVASILKLPNSSAVSRAIGRLEAKVSGQGASPEYGHTSQIGTEERLNFPVSQAKPPVKPLGGTAQAGDDNISEDMPFDEYLRVMNARQARERRGR